MLLMESFINKLIKNAYPGIRSFGDSQDEWATLSILHLVEALAGNMNQRCRYFIVSDNKDTDDDLDGTGDHDLFGNNIPYSVNKWP